VTAKLLRNHKTTVYQGKDNRERKGEETFRAGEGGAITVGRGQTVVGAQEGHSQKGEGKHGKSEENPLPSKT